MNSPPDPLFFFFINFAALAVGLLTDKKKMGVWGNSFPSLFQPTNTGFAESSTRSPASASEAASLSAGRRR